MTDNFNGWLNIYKNKGCTSLSISRSLKKKFKIKKLGHLGTLDPLAEGVLPIAIGEATKAIKFISNHKKRYSFVIKWGEETDTCDSEGEIINRSKRRPSFEDIKYIISEFFVGEISQTPPVFSAVKVGGKRAYDLARKKIEIKLKKKQINIFSLEAKELTNENFCKFDLICSQGTYVRSLARDIAYKLGTVGFAYEIIRTEDNIFKTKNSIPLESILKFNCKKILQKLMPIECVLDKIKIINLEKKYSDMLKNGMVIKLKFINDEKNNENKLVLVKNNSKLVCIANLEKEYIIPRRNFNL